jgi:hypothetical protein
VPYSRARLWYLATFQAAPASCCKRANGPAVPRLPFRGEPRHAHLSLDSIYGLRARCALITDGYRRSAARLRRNLEHGVARIPPADLDVVFYLYPDRAAAESGRKIGGSGFWVGVQSGKIEHLRWSYAVSNRHVVHRAGASTIRANSKDGRLAIFEREPTDWIEDPSGHDIAILPIVSTEVPGFSHMFVPIPMFATPNHVYDQVIGIGDDVFMIGRFINHEGTTRNTPSVRFGNISMLPGEPIFIDKNTPPQESFAVELRSMCGYSGSPVFVQAGGLQKRDRSYVLSGYTDYLLGVHWGHIIEPWTVDKRIRKKAVRTALKPDEQEINEVSANTGMNGVVPAWFLLDLINLPRFKDQRDQEEAEEMKQIARDSPGAVLDSAKEQPHTAVSRESVDDTNPNHLADFRRLVDVAARKRPQDDQT